MAWSRCSPRHAAVSSGEIVVYARLSSSSMRLQGERQSSTSELIRQPSREGRAVAALDRQVIGFRRR